ncbi:pre-mRNA-splicing factor CWC25 homolog [Dendrobium catenatum]|uniref:CBF1-interacting co-repressor CIR N-terminal domain-containing protein n=1 Tax=Dendrobium catenatum TaxID=906689 RepID=A0A2I0WGL6_9ASPA|nr:pre-mRNA-splicing factor CWC25 homolog [Dendrobium catenatum]PKU74806.1 hypothetical protein MA16_Dca004997 [Dendrobium catenatum]
MALKFLNKKGWHTGSLRNIENVWKAEQKHDAEQKKLEELRKQIHEERERSEFRQLQEAAGLVPRQERLDFLYESGLAVGKGSSDGFKALQVQSSGGVSTTAAESSSSKAAVPGALFEEKPQSANDAWRKLHSDPLLLIRQREQEALSRIKNNPVRMAMIRKSIESGNKQQEVKKERQKKRNKHKHDQSNSKDKNLSKSQSDSEYEDHRRRDRSPEWQQHSNAEDKEDRRNEEKEGKRKINHTTKRRENSNENVEKHSSIVRSDDLKSDRHKHSEHDNHSSRDHFGDKYAGHSEQKKRSDNYDIRKSNDRHSSKLYSSPKHRISVNEEKRSDALTTKHNLDARNTEIHSQKQKQNTGYNNRRGVPKMTEEEREARLREMQMDAELHEDQRWKRLKKAAEADALEAKQATYSRGKSFLDATQKSVYGMGVGGSATIEESVRRRTYYSQGHSAHESNAFRR